MPIEAIQALATFLKKSPIVTMEIELDGDGENYIVTTRDSFGYYAELTVERETGHIMVVRVEP